MKTQTDLTFTDYFFIALTLGLVFVVGYTITIVGSATVSFLRQIGG